MTVRPVVVVSGAVLVLAGLLLLGAIGPLTEHRHAQGTDHESRTTLSGSARVFRGTADITYTVKSMGNALGVVEGCRVDMTVASEFTISADATVTLFFADWPLHSGHVEGNPISRQWFYCFAPSGEESWGGEGKSGPNPRIYSTSGVLEGDSVLWSALQIGQVGSIRVDVGDGSSPAQAVGSARLSIDTSVLTISGTEVTEEVIEDFRVYVIEFELDEVRTEPIEAAEATEGASESDDVTAPTRDPNCEKRVPENRTGAQSQLIQPQGDVFIYSVAFERWIGPISGETILRPGDAVRTGPGGRARVVFDDLQGGRDTVEVSPNTLMNIPFDDPDALDPGTTIFAVKIWRGAVKIFEDIVLTIEKPCSRFSARTPFVVTGTRGTEFLVTYDDQTGVSTVTVNEGVVEVWPVDDPGDVHELL